MKSKEVIAHISSWLERYSERSGTKGFVVGISGGIDSAVTSALCANTGLPVLCVQMPIHQSPDQVSRATEHIDWLKGQGSNVSEVYLDLTSVFDDFVTKLSGHSGPAHEMALVNSRARLRMTTLYYYAGYHSYLVAGTGNKVEDFGIGFYTKYGDGGVDLSPIADLNKTEVYSIGQELGILQSIMDAPPTDGLWSDNRTDEDAIGASYPELEWAMEYDPLTQEGELSFRQKEVLDIYTKLNKVNQHKMVPIPVCEIPEELRS